METETWNWKHIKVIVIGKSSKLSKVSSSYRPMGLPPLIKTTNIAEINFTSAKSTRMVILDKKVSDDGAIHKLIAFLKTDLFMLPI